MDRIMVITATKTGQLETLKWLSTQHQSLMCSSAEHGAGRGGHIHIIDFLIDRSVCDTHTASYYAASNGHFNMVKYLHKINPASINNAIYGAITGGNLEILEYVYEHGAKLEKNRIFSCVHLHIWQWLIENDHFEYHIETIIRVALCGNLECLQYIHSKGFDVAHKSVMDCAILHCHVNVITWLHQMGAPCNPQFDYSVLFKDDPRSSTLRQLLHLGYDFSRISCETAARDGNLRALQYQHANGYVLNNRTIEDAALGGHLEIIIWCRQQGCEWDSSACSAAAKGNHLGILKWLRGINRDQWTIGSNEIEICPWNRRTCANAIYYFEVDILMFAIENNCEYLYDKNDNLHRNDEFKNRCRDAISKLDPITAAHVRKKLNFTIDN